MNWLRKRVIAWVREDWDEAHRFDGRKRSDIVTEDYDTMDDPIKFELQGVVGGHLLRVRQPYNHKIDKTPSTTYIIQSGEDVGARIAKIISMELLK
jgi:hypothetical protein